MKNEVEVIERKVWEIPSLNKLEVIQTFAGGSGDEDNSLSGPEDL